MPKHHIGTVDGLARPFAPALTVWVRCPNLAASAGAGQFVMVRRDTTYDPYLREPVVIHGVSGDTIALHARVRQPVYTWLSHARIGDQIDLVGPCGRRIRPRDIAGNLALISQGSGYGPLAPLLDMPCDAAHMISHVPTPGQAYPPELVPVSVEMVTHVGRDKASDFWASVAEAVAWAHHVYAVGSTPFYERLRETISRTRVVIPEGFAQVWIDHSLGCGIGACQTCIMPTRRGGRHVCIDGPFYDLFDPVLT